MVLDTLRADRTTALPGAPPTTPSLQALGASGVVYRQAVAPSSWTLPSMAALFSGRDAYGNRHAAVPDHPALAERFAEAGYRTVAIVANPLLSADNGFARGFESYDVAPATSTADLLADVADLRAWDAEALVARALGELAATPDDRPLFLWLHLMDSHVPYDPANKSLAAPRPGWSALGADGRQPVAWAESLDAAQHELLTGWRRSYDAQIVFADRALGRLFERWSEQRRRAPLVAVTSDHGEGLFSHLRDADSPAGPGPLGAAYHDHGEQLYEEALRVPLWLSGPEVPAGHDERRPVTLRDLGATLCQLAGLDTDGPRLPLAAEDPVPPAIFGAGTRGWFVRTPSHKLLLPYPEREHPDVRPRLYAVEAERYAAELQDLSADEADLLEDLKRRWRSWREGAPARDEGPLDPATAERMKALGYTY